MLRFKSLALCLSVLAAALWASPSDASVVQALELEELVERSDRIFLGRVDFSEAYMDGDGGIRTRHYVVVERHIRGTLTSEAEVVVETLGGIVGDLGARVEGEPQLTVGERVLVFGREGATLQAVRPVGMGQGVMRVRTRGGVDHVRQTRAGMLLMRRNAQGRLQKAEGALPREERLDTFLSRVRTLAERKAGDSRD